MFKVNKTDTSKTKDNWCSTLVRFEKTLHIVSGFYGRFSKNKKISGDVLAVFQCWYPHTFVMLPIAKNSWQRFFNKFKVLFSRKQQGAIRTDLTIYSCISYHLFNGKAFATLLIFSTTIPSLAQYRKQMKSNYIYTFANWNVNLIAGFRNHA